MSTHALPSLGPESDSPDFELYHVYSRVEIMSLLRTLQSQHVLVTIYYSQGEDSLLTNLLAINPDFEELVFDRGTTVAQNERLLASDRLVVVAIVDKVKVQFTAQRAEKTVHEGKPALRLRFPESVLRLQRRDNYRIATPIAQPVKCSVAWPEQGADKGVKRVDLIVADISCGGISVIVDPEQITAQPGFLLKDFLLDLGEIGTVQATLKVRHVSDAGRGGALRRHRLGCTFVRMPGTMSTLIQRYVTTLERDRLTRR